TTLNLLILFVFTSGEELGWRGYLQRRMETAFGVRRGIMLLGLIWGFWHAGMHVQGVMISPDADPLVVTFLITPFYFLGLGSFFGWLYLRTRSVWIPAIAHAAHNRLSSQLSACLDLGEIGDYGAFSAMALGWCAVGLFLLWGVGSPREETETAEDGPPAPQEPS
ncbi:MAG: CPBP family intramembrane metalloprotease, partial [Myxococcota bacterium]|nr:CPBP family intramembrane metalloprotease [Myxococcota bacterium]